jgi:hypothetical protein
MVGMAGGRRATDMLGVEEEAHRRSAGGGEAEA